MRVVIFKTVAVRIIMLMLCYAVMVTSIIIAFSGYIIGTAQRRIYVQSAEANLQLASQNIARDLIEVMALASWCSRSNPPARFLTRPYTPIEAVNSFMRLQEEKRNNRAARYIRRILIVNKDGSKLLHLSDDGSSPLVLPGNSNEKQIEHYPLAAGAEIYDIAPDPYDMIDNEAVLTILSPVYSTSSASAATAIGVVYMAVDTAMISDSLKGSAVTKDSALFLTIGKQTYRLDDGGFSFVKANVSEDPEMTESDTDASYMDTVNCEIRAGMSLTHRLGSEPDVLEADSWMPMLFTVCALVLLLSMAAIFTMDRTISRPVARIRKKAAAIAGGDFSPDPGIESDSEIGEVGRGLNQLSRNVMELMEKRLADEQSKRELEYRMLQGQISSHFLYNTLGSIRWMAALQKAHGIAEMTTALSRLLRTTAKDLRKVVPLRDEISLLDDYYIILKYRYGGAIEYKKHIEDEALLESTLPRFVLQPLMENAIFHGIEPKGKGQLELRVAKRDGCVCITITDDGVGLSIEEMERISDLSNPAKAGPDAAGNGLSSVGLHNVHQRIQNVFGGDYGVTVESEENAYTSVTIRIPYTSGPGRPDKRRPHV